MDLSIRGYIKKNFMNSSTEEINEAIGMSIKDGAEEALPGMGVFFEILWENSSKNEQTLIVNKLKNGLK